MQSRFYRDGRKGRGLIGGARYDEACRCKVKIAGLLPRLPPRTPISSGRRRMRGVRLFAGSEQVEEQRPAATFGFIDSNWPESRIYTRTCTRSFCRSRPFVPRVFFFPFIRPRLFASPLRERTFSLLFSVERVLLTHSGMVCLPNAVLGFSDRCNELSKDMPKWQ